MMVPRVELPPASPLTDHVTAVLNAPVPPTLEEHDTVPPARTELTEQVTVTAVIVGDEVPAASVMTAEADLVGSALLVAVRLTVEPLGMELGAV